jgi:hypothetical protein
MDATIHQSVDKFSGIDNVSLANRMSPAPINHAYVYPLQQATNVEIDNTFGISSRSGYTSVRAGTDIHSLWSDGTICLYVDGGTLYQMDSIYGRKSIRTGLTIGAKMSYDDFNDRVYYSNGYQIGYVSHETDHALVDPVREFKESLPAGQFIAEFMGCLYVAADKILYCSDPLCDYYDTRTGYRAFNSKITMLRPVDEGIYVSDEVVWFLKGKGNEDFDREEASPARAIPYTDVSISGSYIDDGLTGDVALWTGEDGICLGDNSGKVVNLTEARYTFTARSHGAGFIRENEGIRHYINTLY